MSNEIEIITEIPKPGLRAADAHKGSFGRVCIIGGSVGMSGAAALAGRSALRAGAGLVRVATAKSVLGIVASVEPCYTTIALAEDSAGRISGGAVNTISSAIKENDVVAFGPGIGQSASLRSILQMLIKKKGLKLVIDADGLNNLSLIKSWPTKLNAELIVTPHPGEMKKMWSSLIRDQLPENRQEQAVKFAQKSGAIVVLKGAGTVVTDGKKVYTNKTGNPGMATAGSGDVLTGVIAALIGQRLSNFDAAVLGVYIHGLAGDIAAEKTGQVSLIATDIIEALSEAFIKSP